MPASHIRDRDDMLKAVIQEVWTTDACGGTRVQLERSGDGWLLWCQDVTAAHVSYRESVPPRWAATDTQHLTNWISNEIKALLAVHREPWNRLRGADLPAGDAATYCGA